MIYVCPLFVFSMVVSVTSTVSLSVPVCAALEGCLEGGGSLETDISSGVVFCIICFSATVLDLDIYRLN